MQILTASITIEGLCEVGNIGFEEWIFIALGNT